MFAGRETRQDHSDRTGHASKTDIKLSAIKAELYGSSTSQKCRDTRTGVSFALLKSTELAKRRRGKIQKMWTIFAAFLKDTEYSK